MSKLTAGQTAPDFSLEDQNGHPVRLSDFRGRKVLVYFYPRADTPGCTRQACSVRDAESELTGLNVQPLGISPDPPKKQKKFDDKYTLGFPLLSDVTHEVAEQYGVWEQKTLYGKLVTGITRSAFLIDENGKILGSWYKVKPEDTVERVREAGTISF